jgi:DNA-binding PadR family transcriptional regulator
MTDKPDPHAGSSTVGESDVTGPAVSEAKPRPMTSAVNWALLGLIIERESYAYELSQRFQQVYRNTLNLSSSSHVYIALGVLVHRSLVIEVAGSRAGRQPKPRYRATDRGIDRYRDWLVSFVGEDRRRQSMFVLGLSALVGKGDVAADVLDRYEQAWLAHDTGIIASDASARPVGPGGELVARVLPSESRLTVQAKLAWIEQVRQALGDLAARSAG